MACAGGHRPPQHAGPAARRSPTFPASPCSPGPRQGRPAPLRAARLTFAPFAAPRPLLPGPPPARPAPPAASRESPAGLTARVLGARRAGSRRDSRGAGPCALLGSLPAPGAAAAGRGEGARLPGESCNLSGRRRRAGERGRRAGRGGRRGPRRSFSHARPVSRPPARPPLPTAAANLGLSSLWCPPLFHIWEPGVSASSGFSSSAWPPSALGAALSAVTRG